MSATVVHSNEFKVYCPHCRIPFWVESRYEGLTTECQECRGLLPLVRSPASIHTTPSGTIDISGSAFVIPQFNLVMVRVDPGSFIAGDDRYYRGESPEHHVLITHTFWMSEAPVTQDLFEHVMQDNPSRNVGAKLPVESVTWHRAQEFCHTFTVLLKDGNWFPSRTVFRLPTEMEWEFSSCLPNDRNGATEHDHPAVLEKIAWFAENSNGTPREVRTLSPNRRGLYDTLGNVMEWCCDWYHPYSARDAVNPLGPDIGERKVVRGGSYGASRTRCRVSTRLAASPNTHSPRIGFRLAMCLE